MLASETNTSRGLVLTLPILRLMNPIEGWLGEDEADLLIATTWKALTELSPLNAVVEVGSYCGRSTVVLASVVKAICAQTKVYAIDPHTGIVGSQDRLKRDAFCYMLSNNTIKGRAETQGLMTMAEADILSVDFFISFLLRRSLAVAHRPLAADSPNLQP